MAKTVTISLPWPPSSNTYYRRGRFATYLAPSGRAYKENVAEVISTHYPQLSNPLEGRLAVFLSISAPNKRKVDIDNRIKPVLDALQDAGVYDNDEQIDFLSVTRCPIGKGYCNVVIVEEDCA